MNNVQVFMTRFKDILIRYPFVSGFLLTFLVACPFLFCIGGVGLMISSSSDEVAQQETPIPTQPVVDTIPILSPTSGVSADYPFPTRASYPAPSPTQVGYPAPSPTQVGYPAPSPTRASYPAPSPTRASYPAPSPTRASYPAPSPTRASYPAPTTPNLSTPAPVTNGSNDIPSHGLGLHRTLWEKEQGNPENNNAESPLEYQNGAYFVVFEQNVVRKIERRWNTKEAVPFEDAQNIVRRFRPNDSVLLATEQPSDAVRIEYYHSEWLKTQFPDSDTPWAGAEPGEFTIRYNLVDGRTIAFLIFTGNQQ